VTEPTRSEKTQPPQPAKATTGGETRTPSLSDLGLVDEHELAQLTARRYGLPFTDAEHLFPILDKQVAQALPRRFLDHEHCVPIRKEEDTVIVASSDGMLHTGEIAKAVGARRVDVRIVTATDLNRLQRAVDLGQVEQGTDQASTVSMRTRDLMATASGAASAELVNLFDSVLLDAIAQRASDVHLEVYGERVRVRLRIDGDLHDVTRYRLTVAQLKGVMNVIKVNADLDIAERRLPQGGRITTRVGGEVFDLRVQTQPSLHGEHVVIRLLPQEQKILGIEDLGFSKPLAEAYERLLSSPQGLVLVVGPTGSGKSTTLYAGLMVLARDTTRKVITVEDPIEYALHGVQQTQTRAEIDGRKMGLVGMMASASPTPCARSSARTRTSSSSARSATARRRSRPFAPARRATSCSRRCTATTPSTSSSACATSACTRTPLPVSSSPSSPSASPSASATSAVLRPSPTPSSSPKSFPAAPRRDLRASAARAASTAT